ncbi:hypothetical protein SLA2020_219270 [Shorea laevis]
MEGAAASGGSLPMSSSSRKEWRVVLEHHPVRNAGGEELERSNLGQSDERTIYEVQHGREPADVDFGSITMDGSLDNDILQQRLSNVTRQRENLQNLEIELRARAIARSEIMEMQSSFDTQIKEHANTATKLQEQLREREQSIHELKKKVEEKDRELNAIKLEKESAWAKEDLLREQNKELATFRRERDNSEAERAQHIKQIHDLQEHIQEKERQFIELQDQYDVAKEAIIYKDKQWREAQAWIARAQEMDVLQSNTNHSLQAELRERTEQYSQLWLGCQRQFAEMERLHLHAIQQLQLELANSREQNGTYADSQTNLKDSSQFGQNSGNQLDANGAAAPNANGVILPNGTSDNIQPFAAAGNATVQNDHAPSVSIAPSSILGMHTYLPPGQVTALHSFVMHQQGVPQSMSSHVPQSHVGHFHSMAAMPSIQQWQNQQTAVDGSQLSGHSQVPASQNDQNLVRSDGKYEYEISVNQQVIGPEYLDQVNQGPEPNSVVTSSTGKPEVLESVDSTYLVAAQPEHMQQLSSQFDETLRMSSDEQRIESKEQNILNLNSHGLESQVLTAEEASSAASVSPPDTLEHSFNVSETTINNGTGLVLPDAFISAGQVNIVMAGKTSEIALLDERSLLACIVRTIPASGRIRISSTLPNRLSKMLSPLHWHDYKKKYGKLDDFVASHPELFVIEGDYIQLREGAQEMIAATAAAAKFAAAATATPPRSTFLPSVAVTPMAQPHRLKKLSSVDSNHVKNDNGVFREYTAITTTPADASQFSVMQNQTPNGIGFGLAGGLSNVKILSKSKDSELNGPNFNQSIMTSTENRGSAHARFNAGFVGRQQGRTNGSALTSRR